MIYYLFKAKEASFSNGVGKHFLYQMFNGRIEEKSSVDFGFGIVYISSGTRKKKSLYHSTQPPPRYKMKIKRSNTNSESKNKFRI